jgi:hypothetical protein
MGNKVDASSKHYKIYKLELLALQMQRGNSYYSTCVTVYIHCYCQPDHCQPIAGIPSIVQGHYCTMIMASLHLVKEAIGQ